jgi:Rps23 Pro-64 3,4-dihydroxylase Tpa1-like proline 4-hydroxylase
MIRWPRDLAGAAKKFRGAKPFAHLVIDRAVVAADHARMAAAFADEPQMLLEDEIYLHLRSSDPPMTQALRDFCMSLQVSCSSVAQICGQQISRADGSAYSYLKSHYLLPHSDSRKSEGRAIAYAYYVGAPDKGGELELFSCAARKGEIVKTRAAKRIAARANRLVLFEVHDLALHQVREVTRGARTSIAGWFYP